jgi:predicted nucleic acid-binding protein
MNYLTDTNILIYYFANSIPEKELEKINKIFQKSFNISVITKIEFLGWDKHTDDGFQKAREFIDFANTFPLNNEITELAIKIRRKSHIKLPDAVIAATSLIEDLILVTRNEKDFKNINDLEIYNPF